MHVDRLVGRSHFFASCDPHCYRIWLQWVKYVTDVPLHVGLTTPSSVLTFSDEVSRIFLISYLGKSRWLGTWYITDRICLGQKKQSFTQAMCFWHDCRANPGPLCPLCSFSWVLHQVSTTPAVLSIDIGSLFRSLQRHVRLHLFKRTREVNLTDHSIRIFTLCMFKTRNVRLVN